MTMQNNQIQQPNKGSNYELKRQERLREEQLRQKRRAMQKVIKTTSILLVVGGVIGLIGWQGVNMSRKRTTTVVSSSKEGLAPDFNLPSTSGGTIRLSDFRNKKNVLIYFNEGLSCQPCWEQIPELEKALPEFEKMNIVLLTVVLDPVDKWQDIIDQYKITTPILSYESVKTESDYNLLPYSMGMGRRAGHTFVLVDKDGVIKWRRDYWPSRGHMVAGGTMFVTAQDIVEAMKKALNQ